MSTGDVIAKIDLQDPGQHAIQLAQLEIPVSPVRTEPRGGLVVQVGMFSFTAILTQKECESLGTAFTELASKLKSGLVTATSIPSPSAPVPPLKKKP